MVAEGESDGKVQVTVARLYGCAPHLVVLWPTSHKWLNGQTPYGEADSRQLHGQDHIGRWPSAIESRSQ